MQNRPDHVDGALARLDGLVSGIVPALIGAPRTAAERWRADAASARFHLRPPPDGAPRLVAVIGGTGTGKSTLVNRLLGAEVSATSYRRTFTTGPIAMAAGTSSLPEKWLGIPHAPAAPAELPARGRADSLVVVTFDSPITRKVTLIDTPDLDGDQPAHHAEADRVFRWAQAILFLVTPEKYQMTELMPYYRLALRYGIPCLFAMNKCEEQEVVADYGKVLAASGFDAQAGRGDPALERARPEIFVIPRDDASFEADESHNLNHLRAALMEPLAPTTRAHPARARIVDLLSRFEDQLAAPLRDARRDAERLSAAIRAMETPVPGVDVNPLTQQLQRRLQQRSVLYLIGPQRMLERARQAPAILMRLPRFAWDYVMRGEAATETLVHGNQHEKQAVPDFRALLTDQFAVLQSRIDDALRATPAGLQWLSDAGASGYAAARLDAAAAGKIADEELAELTAWLEKRWNATPRDTRALQALLRFLPGGKKLTAWTEAAPYLLTLIVLAHHVLFFGHLDLLVLGGYSLATWLSERISNEVTSRTRRTNQRIIDRFTAMGHDQIERICEWLARQAPPADVLKRLSAAADDLARAAGIEEVT